jgi:hypothetical protein
MSLGARLTRAERVARERLADVVVPELVIPNVMDFALGSDFLAWETLYPIQGTLLKTIFLQPELYTDFDRQVLDGWTDGFRLSADRDGPWFGYDGSVGMPPMAEHIERCRAEGRRWFREVLLVVGRRGSKGVLGAIAGTYVLWHYLVLGDPQRHYGISPSRQLRAMVFAGKRAQAQLAIDPIGALQGGMPISTADAAVFDQMASFRPFAHGTLRGYQGERTPRRQIPRPKPRGRY